MVYYVRYGIGCSYLRFLGKYVFGFKFRLSKWPGKLYGMLVSRLTRRNCQQSTENDSENVICPFLVTAA